MKPFMALLCLAFALNVAPARAASAYPRGVLMLSGNETKIDLTSGGAVVSGPEGSDSISVLDFSTFPPTVEHLRGIPNTVIGPPSNIAISPNQELALIANSIRTEHPRTNMTPETHLHILDLTVRPPRIRGRVETDAQPSGISFTPDGRHALVAHRAAGTVSVLAIDGFNVRQTQSLKVCDPALSVSDVAVAPNGRTVLASLQKGYALALLTFENGRLSATGRLISTYGMPYRCLITPDGKLGLTAGQGAGNGLDADALTVIDLTGAEPRAADYVPLGAVPESIEVSPDGRWVAAVLMEGSNLAPNNPLRSTAGSLVLLERRGQTYVRSQRLPIGRIPEGVAFTGNGKHLVVQCHPDRALWVFEIRGRKVRDTGLRIAVPGMPSSLRAGP